MNAVAAGRLSQRAGIKTKRKGHGPETVPATAAGRALLQHLKPVAPCSRRGQPPGYDNNHLPSLPRCGNWRTGNGTGAPNLSRTQHPPKGGCVADDKSL